MPDPSTTPPDLTHIRVRWSEISTAFVAWSEKYPGLTHTDPWSSLAAVDGLLDTITAVLKSGLPYGHLDLWSVRTH